MRGGGHGEGSCLGGRGRRCLGSTSSDSEVSDSPTELRQRTRKQNAWSLRNPPKRLEFTWCIRLRLQHVRGVARPLTLTLTLTLTSDAPSSR